MIYIATGSDWCVQGKFTDNEGKDVDFQGYVDAPNFFSGVSLGLEIGGCLSNGQLKDYQTFIGWTNKVSIPSGKHFSVKRISKGTIYSPAKYEVNF